MRLDVIILLTIDAQGFIARNPTTPCLFGTVSLITRTPTTAIRKRIVSLGELNTPTGVRSRARGE
jgi:hypothetical protein